MIQRVGMIDIISYNLFKSVIGPFTAVWGIQNLRFSNCVISYTNNEFFRHLETFIPVVLYYTV